MNAKVERSSTARISLWRNRSYLLLWSGQAVSTIGTSITDLALPLLILTLTNSPAIVGLASAVRALPYAIFSLIAGALIDRWNRKRTMIFCDLGRILALGSIPLAFWLGKLTIIQVIFVFIIEGTFFVFFNIAEAASLPNVVTEEQIPAAVAQNQATMSTSLLLGPSLGGFLYGLGSAIPFLVDTFSYIVSVISLLFIKTEFQTSRPPSTKRLGIEIREGLLWLWQQPVVRSLALLTGGINMVLSGQPLLIIVLARQQHASAFLIGFVLAISGVGGIIGSLLSPFFQKRFKFGQIIIGVCWIFTVLSLLYAAAPIPLVLGIIAAGFFLVGPAYNVVQYSYRLSLIPDELQGRVNSAFRLIAFGAPPLGMFVTGVLLQQFGTLVTILVFTITLAILALATTANKHIRNAQSPSVEAAEK